MTKERSRAAAVGIAGFLLVFGGLAAFRFTGVEPSGRVQSLLVQAGAVVLFVSIATYASRGGEPVPAFLAALGPGAGFTMTLFLSGPTEAFAVLVAYGFFSGVVVAGLLTLFGYVAGRAAVVLTKDREN